MQTLSDAESREVTFTYQGDRLHEMKYLNRTWTYDWNSEQTGHLEKVTPPAGGAWEFAYDGHQVSQVTTPNGGQVSYQYLSIGRGSGRVVQQRRALGTGGVPEATWTFTYDGITSTVVGPLNTTVYTFYETDSPFEGTPKERKTKNGTGNVLEEEDLSWQAGLPVGLDDTQGTDTRHAYGPLLTARTVMRDGNTWSADYTYAPERFNDYGQPWKVEESGAFLRTTTRTFWNSSTAYIRGQVSTVTVSQGGSSFETTLSRDDNGFVSAKSVYGVSTEYLPDAHGNVASETDANNHGTSYSYSWGVPSGITAPHHTISRVINPDGTIQNEERAGFRWDFLYDDLGRETSRQLKELTQVNGQGTWTSVGFATGTEYDPTGAWVKTTRGRVWTKTFLDGLGRTTGTENAVGTKTSTQYNGWGGVSYEGYPFQTADVGTSISYDDLGRVRVRTNPDNTTVHYAYDGLKVTVTNERGKDTVQQWEATGDPTRARLISVTHADDTPSTPAPSRTTRYTYDLLGSLTLVEHPDGTTRSWSYGAHHWLIGESHPESGAVTYDHDGDNVGNITKRTDANGVVLEYTYDDENRLLAVKVDPAAHPSGTADDLRFQYDGWGNRWAVENRYVSRVHTFAANRLDHTVEWTRPTGTGDWSSARTTAYTYDDNDNVQTITYPAGTRTVSYHYDDANRITLVHEEGGTVYADAFSYHPSGAIAQYTSGNGIVNGVTYDDPHQRYWPHEVTASGVLGLTYTYDTVGNVESITGAASGAQGFGYDALDRLTSATGPWGTETYGYDAVGNRISKNDNTEYHYDGNRNRLTSTTGNENESLTYDEVGNLIGDALGTYTYTPFNMLREARMFSGVTPVYGDDADQLRTISTIGGVCRTYIHGPGGVVLTELKEEAGTSSWVRDYIYAGTRLIASVRQVREKVFVTVGKRGHGAGSVTGSVDTAGTVLTCDDACQTSQRVEVNVGRRLTLTATAGAGSKFAGWFGACSGTSATLELPVGEDDIDCRARFIIPTPLTVELDRTARGSGRITARDMESGQIVAPAPETVQGKWEWEFDTQSVVTLTANPADGDTAFANWSGDCTGTNPVVSITMSGAMGCTAKFVPVFWLHVKKEGPGAKLSPVVSTPAGIPMGISCDGICDVKYLDETVVTLTPQLASGVTFDGWSGDGCGDTVLMTGERTCTAKFKVVYPKLQPANEATGVPTSVVLTWSPPMAGVGNWVCINTTNTPCDRVANPWTPTGHGTKDLTLLPGTTYHWQVKTTLPAPDNQSEPEANEGQWWTFTTAGSPPLQKQAPANMSTGQPTTVILRWTATGLSGAGYWVCLDHGPCSRGDGTPNGQGLSKELSGLTAGTHYWQVRADTNTDSVLGDGGAWWSFTVGSAPPAPGAFDRTAPAPGATMPQDAVILSWTASSGVDHYEYCVDTSANATCDTGWVYAGTQTSVTPPGLSSATTYFWQVKAINTVGQTDASGGWGTFTTADVPRYHLVVGKTGAQSGVSLVTSSPSGTPTAISCGNTCDVTYPAGTTVTLTAQPSTGVTFVRWSGTGCNADGTVVMNEARACTAIFTVSFAKSGPTNGQTGVARPPTVSWSPSAVPDAGYWVCRDTTNDNACDGNDWVSNGQALSKQLDGLLPGTTYYWQVRVQTPDTAFTEADIGTWWSFTTPPGAFGKTAPAAGATTPVGPVTLTWGASSGATRYEYCIDEVPNNSCDTGWLNVDGATSVVPSTLPGVTYSWQVRAVGPGGTTDSGDGWTTFTTDVVRYHLVVNKTGAQSGVSLVTSSPAGTPTAISCGPTCDVTYPAGTTVTLVAQPSTGVTFRGWSGTECATGTVVMNQTRTCTATFTVEVGKTAPLTGATGVSPSATLSWAASAVPGAGYWVCMGDTTNDNVCDGNQWVSNGQATTKQLTGASASTTYYWQVRVATPDGALTEADNGAWWSFTTPPGAFGKTAPAAGATTPVEIGRAHV